MDPTPVDRCVCFKVTFAELLRLRAETGAGFEQLRERTGCGKGCGLCAPYAKAALATGRARLAVMTPEELERVGASERRARDGPGRA